MKKYERPRGDRRLRTTRIPYPQGPKTHAQLAERIEELLDEAIKLERCTQRRINLYGDTSFFLMHARSNLIRAHKRIREAAETFPALLIGDLF